MPRRLTLKEKIYRCMKVNEPADDIYSHFFRFKSIEERKEALNVIKGYAKTSNKEIAIRSKALAILGYLKEMCCGEEVPEYYKDGSIICSDTEIPIIIEDNCKELVNFFKENPSYNWRSNQEVYNWLFETILSIEDYKIKSEVTKMFLNYITENLLLANKEKKESLDEDETYILEQIKRVRDSL